MSFDAVFEADQRTQAVHSGLIWRSTSSWRGVGLGVVKF
jgi:hypothetical protein